MWPFTERPRLSLLGRLWLGVSIWGVFVVYWLPLLLMGGLSWFAVVSAVALTALAPLNGDTVATGAGNVLAVALVVAVIGSAAKQGWRLPWRALGQVAVLGFGLFGLAWGSGNTLTGELATGSVHACWFLATAAPILWLGARSAGWALAAQGALELRVGFARLASIVGTLLVVPPLLGGYVTLNVVEKAAEIARDTSPEELQAGLVAFSALLEEAEQESRTRTTETCFEELQPERAQVIWNLRGRYSLPDEEIEDCASAALLDVCTSESLATYENLPAVYQTAARNLANDWYRRGRRYGEPPVEDLPCGVWEPDEVRLVSEVRIADEALLALEQRKPQVHAALRLWSAEVPHAEIGLRLGISERQSRDFVNNGLVSLRTAVERQCGYSSP